MAMRWDSRRNMFVDDGSAPTPPQQQQRQLGATPPQQRRGYGADDPTVRAAVAVSHTVGGTVLDAFGLHGVTTLIEGLWRRGGYL